jgi:hypothetical protein
MHEVAFAVAVHKEGRHSSALDADSICWNIYLLANAHRASLHFIPFCTHLCFFVGI